MFKKNRKLSMHVKDVIEHNDQAGIRPSKIFQALVEEAGGRSNLKFLEKDVINYISGKLRINGDDTDAQEMLDYFTRMKEQNPNFSFTTFVSIVRIVSSMHFGRMLDQELLTSILVTWCHLTPHTSSTSNFFFLDSLIYKLTDCPTYEMPVAAFVGVNQHGRSCLFGCALLENEETESFEWLMQIFIKCMEKTPDGILTD
ncbi:hypothetical protein Ahy_B02g059064 isoform B [Arachis hypogaea]|uniref:MULE transposase domain-containing protein n=1 Tax=Arachis hypogaea TaxID=3818 RepID=A0A445AG47_ARAHY|nr:hypothetical protein Ahy_B02g059064 isoform B [Arachis hypogaea]